LPNMKDSRSQAAIATTRFGSGSRVASQKSPANRLLDTLNTP